MKLCCSNCSDGMREGRGQRGLEQDEYLENAGEEVLVIFPVMKAACLEPHFARRLKRLHRIPRPKISKVSSKDSKSFGAHTTLRERHDNRRQ